MAHRPAFSEVLFERDDADVGREVLSGEFECEGGRVVFGAVVDDEELVGACTSSGGGGCGCAEVCEGGVEHGGETRRFVVGGNDDAQVERAFVGERGEREGCRWGRV